MNYKKIITDSWKLAEEHPYLQWFAVLPMMAFVILDSVYTTMRFGPHFVDNFYDIVRSFVENVYGTYHAVFVLGVVVIVMAVIVELFLVAFFEGAIIGMINNIIENNNKKVRSSVGVAYGFDKYLELVKLHALLSMMNPFLIPMGMLILRDISVKFFNLLLWPMLFIFIINVIVKIGTSYSDYSVVIKGDNVINSIRKSFSIVFIHFKETMFIMLVLVLIVIRAVLNLIVVFLVPVVLIWIANQLGGVLPFAVTTTIIIILSVLVYYFTVKFATFIMVFSNAIWVYTFKELAKSRDKIFEISDEKGVGSDK